MKLNWTMRSGEGGCASVSNRQIGAVAHRDHSSRRSKVGVVENTGRRRHVCGRAGVEVPVGRTRWCSGDAGGVERGVESGGVPDRWWRRGWLDGRRHGLLGLERRPWSQDAGAGCPEWHGPCLDQACPGVVAGSPLRVRGWGPGCAAGTGDVGGGGCAAPLFLVLLVARSA